MAAEDLISGAEGHSNGIAFLVAAGFVGTMVAAACSSPQTTEINAHKRADTLMKWVRIGLFSGAVFVAIAAALDPKHAPAAISGGALAGGFFYFAYAHARESGLAAHRDGLPGTEEY